MFNNKITINYKGNTVFKTSSGELVGQKLVLEVEYVKHKPLVPKILSASTLHWISEASNSTRESSEYTGADVIVCCTLSSFSTSLC